MGNMVLVAQFMGLALTAALFGLAFVLGLKHMRAAVTIVQGGDVPAGTEKKAALPTKPASMGLGAGALVAAGMICGAGLFLWRAATEGKSAIPLSNHFDAFLVLALLLAVVVMYLRWTRHLRALSFFMLPMIAAMLVLGGILEIVSPGTYHYESVWDEIHVATVVMGSLCFALACVGAIVYLVAARQLKRKGGGGGMGPATATGRKVKFPPLAAMEKFNQWMVYLGFPLLTVAIVAGVIRMAQGHVGTGGSAGEVSAWQMSPKVGLAVMAWLIYGILLHIPLAPSFRGQRAAWLSIIGFVLFLSGYAATKWMK